MSKIVSMFKKLFALVIALAFVAQAHATDPTITVPTMPDTFVTSVTGGLLIIGGLLVLIYSQRKAIRVFLSMLGR